MLASLGLALLVQAADLRAIFPPASDRLIEATGDFAHHPNLHLRELQLSGSSLSELGAQMSAQGPVDRDGQRHDGWTYGDVSYQFNVGACRPERTETSIDLIVVLPDLASRDRLSASDKADWDRYFAALVAHEAQHVAIIERGAEWIGEAMRAASSCDAAIAAGAQANARLQAAHKAYDGRTDHGRLEGASL